MAIQESGEMYLETILILSRHSDNVHAIDVGKYMGYSKPSVSRAMGILKDDGFIKVVDTGEITLTAKGRKRAEAVYERHNVITELLKRIGVSEKTAIDDACRAEHYISDETFNALKKLLGEMEK